MRKRYNTFTKRERIDRILAAEEYIATQNQRWTSGEFE